MWIPLIIIATFLIALFIYYYCCYCKVEKFTDPVEEEDALESISATLNGIISGDIIAQHPYVEKLADIPSSTQLKIYLTSFSERTHYDNSVKVYIPEMSRWNNFIKDNQSFSLVSTQGTMPIIRPDGMKLNNIGLVGIPSDELAIVGTQNALPSFSATFFIKFEKHYSVSVFQIPIGGFELLKIYLETPNYARLTLKNKDDDNCELELELGNGSNNTLKTGDISKSNLMTGDAVAITITCNISSTKITPHIYIGKMSTGTAPTYSVIEDGSYTKNGGYQPGERLTLGNSQITINKNKDSLDASLLAFMYHSKEISLSEHELLTQYLTSQNTSLPVIATVLTDASTKLQQIKDYITNNTATQGTLQQQLNACKASIPPVVKAFGHKITMNGISSVSSEDLRSCSVLEIKNRLNNAIAATTATETPSTESSRPRFQISVPAGLQNIAAIAP